MPRVHCIKMTHQQVISRLCKIATAECIDSHPHAEAPVRETSLASCRTFQGQNGLSHRSRHKVHIVIRGQAFFVRALTPGITVTERERTM